MPQLPEDLVSILRECCGFLESNDIKYWFGGGLFQCIKEGRFNEVQYSWEHRTEHGKGHDIDFYIMATDILRVKERIRNLVDYKEIGNFSYKLALRKNDQDIEFIYIFPAPIDENVVYFLGCGKKELWRSFELPESLRKRLYRHHLPKEIFGKDVIPLDGLSIRVPSNTYLKILYPDYR